MEPRLLVRKSVLLVVLSIWYIKKVVCLVKTAGTASVRNMPRLTKLELYKQVQDEFVGKVLVPVFPYFIPWMPSKKGHWRKIGNVRESDKIKFETKLPILILGVVSEEELDGFVPMKGYIRDLNAGLRPEVWIKCLWDKDIVFHRISTQNFFILKQQLMDNL